jgi:RNA polymerase sigma-70 factor (ECF subfamily)
MTTTPAFSLGLGIVDHTPALRRYARMLTQSPDQADDLVQDCVARALSRAHLYQPDTNLRAWLFTIQRNIFMTQARKARLRREHAVTRMAMGADVTQANQFHHVALQESLRLLKSLPAREQQAIALLGILDMNYHEAASHSGVKIGTMKSRLSRGRAHLRELAEPTGGLN